VKAPDDAALTRRVPGMGGSLSGPLLTSGNAA
jgi:hypothetical protein